MPADKTAEAKTQLAAFFLELKELGKWYHHWTGAFPKTVHISPDILAQLSRIEGFYQREELGTKVSAYSPVIRYFHLGWGVVTIIEDWEEKFLHFD